MIEFLTAVDTSLFYFINTTLAIPTFDYFFEFFTAADPLYARQIWLGIFAVSLILLAWKGGTRGRITVAALLVGVVVSDQLSSFFIKPFFARVRPCSALVDVRLLIGCGAGYSFPSSHAVNTFFAAFTVSTFYPSTKRWVFTVAAIVSYSRIYVGVHYPGDIVAGALLGMLIGYGIVKSFRPFFHRWEKRR